MKSFRGAFGGFRGFFGGFKGFLGEILRCFFGFWGFLKVALVGFLVVFARFRSFSGIRN